MVNPIPEGTHTVTPHLVVRGADRAIEFYKQAFGAVESLRMASPDGTLMHAEIRIGDSAVYLADESPAWGAMSPLALGGTPVTIHLYVTDADAVFERAVQAGATVRMPLSDAFWGDRYGQVGDPFGHVWSIATQIENLTPEEMDRRAAETFASMPAGDPDPAAPSAPAPEPPPPPSPAPEPVERAPAGEPARPEPAARKRPTVEKKPARRKATARKKPARKKAGAKKKPARKKAGAKKKPARKAAKKKVARRRPSSRKSARGAARKKAPRKRVAARKKKAAKKKVARKKAPKKTATRKKVARKPTRRAGKKKPARRRPGRR